MTTISYHLQQLYCFLIRIVWLIALIAFNQLQSSAQVDAGVTDLVKPTDPFTFGLSDVEVKFKNYSASTSITAVDIVYKIDTDLPVTYNWTGSLSPGETSSAVTITSNYNFSNDVHTIKVWTANPNGQTDVDNENDTLLVSVNACTPLQSGTYTIGSGGDYTTFNDAKTFLTSECGIEGPIVFNILDGTYNEHLTIPDIPGTSESNTITFRSASADSTKVTLTASSTSYTLALDDADHIIFEDITIEMTGTFGPIYIGGGSTYNQFNNCRILGQSGTSSLVVFAGMNKDNNVFSQNRMEGAIKGFLNTSNTMGGLEIVDNVLKDQTDGSIHLEWSNSITIHGNVITTSSNTTGIYLRSYSDGIDIAGNRISMNGGGTGIYLETISNTTNDADLIANNFIYVHDGTGVDIWSLTSTEGINFYHNSIHITGTSGTSIGIDNKSDAICSIMNNVIVNEDEGVTISIPYRQNLTSDYNCLVTNGTNVINNSTLLLWQCNEDNDENSFSIDPLFFSDEDLHTLSPHLNGVGTPIADITTDVDGDMRNVSNPDIGADEYDPPTPLSGTYDLGPSATMFKTFNDAADSLFKVGVGGPVTFEVEDGTYAEQVLFQPIAGTSEINTVTFQSVSGDSTAVTLTYEATSEIDNYSLKLDGPDFITFKDMTLEATGAEYARVVEIGAYANNNTFSNCQFLGVSDQSSLVYSNTSRDTNNAFTNNLFKNGQNGINMSGGTTQCGSSNFGQITISGNQFVDQTNEAIHLKWYEYPLVASNYIQGNFPITGIYLDDCWRQYTINSNRVILDNGGTGIKFSNGNMHEESDPSLVYNNFIYVNSINQDDPDFGIFDYLSQIEVKVMYNTIHVVGNNTSSSCLHLQTGSLHDLRNNNLVNKALGKVLGLEQHNVQISDYNNLFTNGINITSHRTDLEERQSVDNKDLNSISVDPYFISGIDHQILNPALDGAATPITEVTEDLDGETRDVDNPDIGADEFTSSPTPLNGTFTIGGTSPDYSTITEAVQDLVVNGIDGPAVFDIATGTYDEQITIPEIAGASETNTVTFQSVSGDSTDVIITHTPNTTYEHTFQLNGADYLIFKGLSITSAEDWGWPIHLTNEATHNRFENNRLYLEGDIGYDSDRSLIYSNGSKDSSNVFISNHFDNNVTGIFIQGSGTVLGTQIKNNTFSNIQYRGIYLNNHDDVEISGNQITVETVHSSSAGIFLNGVNGAIFNNFVDYETTNDGSGWGIYSSGDLDVWHNTVRISGTTGNNHATLRIPANTRVFNNILLNLGGGIVIECDSTGMESDHNILHSTGNFLVFIGILNFNLEDWQSAPGERDLNSVSILPEFLSETDLHTTDPWINNLGTPLAEVTIDIDGESRDPTAPDIGADEFDARTLFAGEYTIGDGGDFESFTDAIDSISEVGVFGDVTFNVKQGIYQEQLTIGAIPYISEDRTVTFQSENENNSEVELSFPGTQSDNFVVKFDGTSFVSFKYMTFSAGDSTYSRIIEIKGNSSDITISNNLFVGAYESGEMIYSGEDQEEDLSILNNVFENGNAGVYLIGGGTGARENGLLIEGNQFFEQHGVAIYLAHQYAAQVLQNRIVQEDDVIFEWVGIYLKDGSGLSSELAYIANNSIAFEAYTKSAGIVLDDASSYQGIFYNSVNIIGDSEDSRSFNQQNGGTGNVVANNIFSNRGNGLVMYTTEPSAIDTDYNDYFATGGRFIYDGSTISNYSTLEEWQLAYPNTELHSISVDPLFESEYDLHAHHPMLHKGGTLISGITVDGDGNDRESDFHGIGAYLISDIIFSLGQDIITCNNDVITLSAGDGFDSYLWQTGETTSSIQAGPASFSDIDYVVTVEMDGVEYKDTISVVFTGPEIDMPDTTGFCMGSSVTITAPEGDYSYLWSNGSINQSVDISTSGEYEVTVTDNEGCTSSHDVHVVESFGPEVQLGNDVNLCDGDSLILDAGPGASYNWSTGGDERVITVKISGVFAVNVTDEYGCIGDDDIQIGIVDRPSFSLGNDLGFCSGNSVLIDPQINGNYTYLWSDGSTQNTVEVTQEGIVSATVTDIITGCSKTESVEVTEYPLPEIVLNYDGDVLEADLESGMIYHWFRDGLDLGETIANNMDPEISGNYEVVVTDENGCIGTSNSVEVVILGLGENEISIYPNPVVDEAQVSDINRVLNAYLIDFTGKVIHREILNGILNVKDLSPGVYILHLLDSRQKELTTLKLIKR